MKKLQQLLTKEKEKLQTAGNYETWQPLTTKTGWLPGGSAGKISRDAKMSGLETLPKQMSDLASTLNTVSSDVELHKEIKRLREENFSLREKNRLLEKKLSCLDSNFNDLDRMAGDRTSEFMQYI